MAFIFLCVIILKKNFLAPNDLPQLRLRSHVIFRFFFSFFVSFPSLFFIFVDKMGIAALVHKFCGVL